MDSKVDVSEEEILRIFYGVLKAIETLHNLNFVHRDISLSNIMFDDNYVPKLIDLGSGRDLGLEKDYELTSLNYIPQKPLYKPPEAFDTNFQYKDKLLAKSHDIWELGILLYEIMDPFLTQQKAMNIQNQQFKALMNTKYLSLIHI